MGREREGRRRRDRERKRERKKEREENVFWSRKAEFLKSFMSLGNCRWFGQFGRSTGRGFVWEEPPEAKLEEVGGQGVQGRPAWHGAEALSSTEQGHLMGEVR